MFLVLATTTLRCATSEDAPDRKVPGGVVDSGADQGTGGSVSDAASDGAEAASDAALDGGTDAVADTSEDATGDGSPDANTEAEAAADAASGDRLLVVGRNGQSVLFGESAGGSFTTNNVTFAAASVPALVSTGFGALSVVRRASDNELDSATWSPSGGWSSLSAIGTGGASIASPALATQGDVHLVFLGTDNKMYENRWTQPTGWQGFGPVSASGVQSFGPSAPTASPLPSPAFLIAQEGSDGDLYTQSFSGSWQSAQAHNLLVSVRAGTPPTATPEGSGALVAYVETGTNKILWTQGSGATWTSPAAVSGATTTDPVSLTTLSNGNVVLAYRGQDQLIYASIFQGSSFSTPGAVSTAYLATGSPSLAPGIAGHVAEILFVSGGAILSSSLSSSVWSTPVPLATGGYQAVSATTYTP